MEDEPFDFSTPITENTVLLAKWDCPEPGHTLDDLLTALRDGTAETEFPVNTQIDDYTNGSYDPWLVGHYGAQYGNSDVTGAYLYRKYVHPVDMAWGSGDNYGESAINTYLNTTYLNSCSDDIKNNVAEIDLPLVNGTTPAKMFLMSAAEVMGMSTGYAGGVAWDGWKERTGLTSPSTQPNAGRVMAKGEIANGSGDAWRLRTEMENNSGEASVTFDGAIRGITSSVDAGIVPACFVPKPSYDPSNPTLAGLKAAIDAGDYAAFPVETKIPDTYNSEPIEWVVGNYGTASMADGSTSEGVYLYKDKALSVTQTFGPNVYYDDSTINTYLNETYLSGCSETFKNIVSEISVFVYNERTVDAKLWLMSIVEILGADPVTGNPDVHWKSWEERTGLTTGSRSANNGRIMHNESGAAAYWWTRSLNSTSTVSFVSADGSITYAQPNGQASVVPACFIAKS